jgi:pyruvate/2-oxoacid:ferredoxin oxidoreductase alpha subunit/Pyruvate/2-oxoacid:ferredoxin oxidoreductase gamma subunit/dihydroorotate dehydrogenase/ferredoxin
MLPNMYKIAGELTPTVFHVAARSLAAQALSIFGDHSDVMTARGTGFAMLCSNSPQEVMDLALIAQAATLAGRVPVLHFFDGFRTSHEVAKLTPVGHDVVRAMIDEDDVRAHRDRALSPARPVIRGTSQNPDVFFQAREASNPWYAGMPDVVQAAMDRFADLTGRRYSLCDYVGDPQARRVVLLMGSGAETAQETVEHLLHQGEPVGLLKLRLYRPFPVKALLDALPESAETVVVLDRTKEPGAEGEPLYKDVVTALAEAAADGRRERMPRVLGGRFGLSSKEFTPGMVRAVLDNAAAEQPRNHFTVGIHDDVTGTSLPWDAGFRTDAHEDTVQAVFFGLGSDGTVGANKNAVKIIGEGTDLHAQGYFVYDSKKSGAVTVSHLRFGPRPIRSTYLIEDGDADFVACHQPVFLDRYPMLDKAKRGAVFLLNSPVPPDRLWDSLPRAVRDRIVEKEVRLFAIDAGAVAAETGMGRRINTVMQSCFFAVSGILPRDQAIAAMKAAVEKTYGRKGRRLVERNFRSIDAALDALHEIPVPAEARAAAPARAPAQVQDGGSVAARAATLEPGASREVIDAFVDRVTREIIAGRGDLVPVSQIPCDGTFPVGTAAIEKRNLALELPVWEPDLCTQCGKCPLVCPHAAIRAKVLEPDAVAAAPEDFKSWPVLAKGFPEGARMSYQVAPEDCTGCTSVRGHLPDPRQEQRQPQGPEHGAPATAARNGAQATGISFVGLPEYPRTALKTRRSPTPCCSSRSSSSPGLRRLRRDPLRQARQPALRRPHGDRQRHRLLLHLRRQPADHALDANDQGRGPAWNNSLFEDNAEFGLGMRLAIDQRRQARGDAPRAAAAAPGRSPRRRHPRGPRARGRGPRAARTGGPRCGRRSRRSTARIPPRPGPGASPRSPRPCAAQRVDRRRRRLGLRHRLRRPGPRARLGARTSTSWCSTRRSTPTPAARPPRPPPGRRGQVLRRRQGRGQEGPGAARHGLRRRLRRPRGLRRQGHADHQGLPRGRGASGTVPDHRLQPLHRSRRRPLEQPPAAEPGGGQRPLAPLPLRPGQGPGRQEPAAPGFEGAERALPGLRPLRGPLRHALADPPGGRGALRRPGPARRGPPLRALPAARGPGLERAREPGGGQGRGPGADGGRRRRRERGHRTGRPGRRSRRRRSLTMADLRTNYLGLELANPLVPSASPLSRDLDTARRLEDAGAAALVMYSLFEEQIEHESARTERFLLEQSHGFGEADSFHPTAYEAQSLEDEYLEQLLALKHALDIPVIASLNGVTPGGWLEHARLLQDAGADALELNLYYVAASSHDTAESVEARYQEIVGLVAGQVRIPIAVKLSPQFTAPVDLARRLEQAGAEGVTLFNRFYQPDLDLDTLEVAPRLVLSTPAEALLRIRWTAILYGQVGLSIGVTGGFHDAADALKALLAGADAVQLCSVLLQKGPEHLGTLLSAMEAWMDEKEYRSVEQLKGSVSRSKAMEPAAYERANYVDLIDSHSAASGVLY